jgi:hypothetical protein
LFSSSSNFLWLKFLVLYWIRVERVDTLVLLLISEARFSVLHHSMWYWLWDVHTRLLLCWSMILIYLNYLGFLSWRDIEFYQSSFYAKMIFYTVKKIVWKLAIQLASQLAS